jgi:PAS domain S-box-containing protein
MTSNSIITGNADSNSIFESAFALLPEPSILIDKSIHILEANESFCHLLKTTNTEVMRKPLFSLFRDNEAEIGNIYQLLNSGIKQKNRVSFKVRLSTGSNSEMRVIVNTRFFQYRDDTLGICSVSDIGLNKQTEAKLKIIEENNHDSLDNTNDIIQLIAPDGSILYVNNKWLKCLGFSQNEISELNITDVIREDQVPFCFKLLDRVKRGEKLELIETVFRAKDGKEIYIEGNFSGNFEAGECVSIRGVFRDYTRRKTVEETYNRLVQGFPMPVYVVQKGIFRFVNPSFLTMTEYTEAELLGSEALAMVHPEDMVYVHINAVRILKTRRSASYEYRMIRKSGELRWVMETAISIPYEGGEACLGTLVDLTERKLSEDALQKSKDRYQTLFNCSSDSICIIDMQNRFLEANDAACKLLGYSRSEYLTKTIKEIASPKYRTNFEQAMKPLFEKGELIDEVESVHKNGRVIPVELHSKLIEYENKQAVLVVSRDISDRKQIEIINKRNQERLESLVRIAQFNSNRTQDLLDYALEEAIKLTNSKLGYIYFYNEHGKELSLMSWISSIGNIQRINTSVVINLDIDGVPGKVAAQHHPLIINLERSQKPDLNVNGYPEGQYSLDRYMTVPIYGGEHIAAIIGVANCDQEYSQLDVQQLSLFMDSVFSILERWQVEQALRESEHRYRQIIELSQDGIIRMDDKGIIEMVNPSACTMFGYTEQELIGQTLLKTYLPEEYAESRVHFGQLNPSRPLRFERIALKKDGARITIESSVSPLTNGHYQEIIRDITTRKYMEKELQENERKYRLLVENQTDLMIELDTRGNFLFANPSYCKLVWKTLSEVLSTSFLAAIYPDDKDLINNELVKVSSPPFTGYIEHRLLTHEGYRWIAWSVNAVLDNAGKAQALTCIGRDITESKEAKEELEKANQRLRELDKLKDNFLSTVSHELRTPLTSIKSFTEILLNYEEDRTTQLEFLGIINEESDRLTRLINDFLDLSKIQAGRMKWQTIKLSFADVIRSVTNITRPVIEKTRLNLSVVVEPALPEVMGDKDRFVQVITNLLGNATKFTPEGGDILIKAWSENDPITNQPTVKVSIKDSGIGIAPEHHQSIFENFGQVGDVLKDRPKGTGLGLPICKKIIEYFGGKIWVESAIGKGTTFIFAIPVVLKPENSS